MENRLLDFVEQLEEILDRGTKVPLTGKIMVDEELILEILDGIRSSLPEEIRHADIIMSERDRLMEEARNEADRIIDRAQKHAEQLLDEDEITAQSRAYAEDIVRKAQQYSRDVKLGALKYSDDLLHDIEIKLEGTSQSLKKSREELGAMTRWDDRIQDNVED